MTRFPHRLLAILAVTTACGAATLAATPETSHPAPDAAAGCPLHAAHMAEAAHRATLDARGDRHMGFRQDATTHHFHVDADGGAVEVTARDAADATTVGQVRQHLQAIRDAFAAGDFSIPEAVHAQVPPGVPALRALGDRVDYRYEELPAGARVRLVGADDEARAAVHEFLRFQIGDHGTGDPVGHHTH